MFQPTNLIRSYQYPQAVNKICDMVSNIVFIHLIFVFAGLSTDCAGGVWCFEVTTCPLLICLFGN